MRWRGGGARIAAHAADGHHLPYRRRARSTARFSGFCVRNLADLPRGAARAAPGGAARAGASSILEFFRPARAAPVLRPHLQRPRAAAASAGRSPATATPTATCPTRSAASARASSSTALLRRGRLRRGRRATTCSRRAWPRWWWRREAGGGGRRRRRDRSTRRRLLDVLARRTPRPQRARGGPVLLAGRRRGVAHEIGAVPRLPVHALRPARLPRARSPRARRAGTPWSVIPCSTGGLARIAHGISDDLDRPRRRRHAQGAAASWCWSCARRRCR